MVNNVVSSDFLAFVFFFIFFIFYYCKWKMESILGPRGTAAINGLLYLSEKLVE
jgi:hypothetical protein